MFVTLNIDKHLGSVTECYWNKKNIKISLTFANNPKLDLDRSSTQILFIFNVAIVIGTRKEIMKTEIEPLTTGIHRKIIYT